MNRKRLISEVGEQQDTSSLYSDTSTLEYGAFVVRGCIERLYSPKDLSQFSGWASMLLLDIDTGSSNIISGKIPFIDFGYIYTFHCKNVKKTFKKEEKSITRDNTTIIKTVNISPMPFSPALIQKLLTVHNIMSPTEVDAVIRDFTEKTSVKSIENEPWVAKLKQYTSYFISDDGAELMRYFGYSKQLLSLTTAQFTYLVEILRRHPHRLCCDKLHDVENVPMMSVDTLQECYRKYNITPCETHILAALKFYQTHMYKMMDTQGSTFINQDEFNRITISRKAKQYLIDNGILVKNGSNYYHCDSLENQNDIVENMEVLISRDVDYSTHTEALNTQLDEYQLHAVELSKTSNILCITGAAGCGKTTVIKEILKFGKENTMILAPRGVAARKVASVTSMDAITIDKLIVSAMNAVREMPIEQTRMWTIKRVIIDEASMMTENHLASLLTFLPNICQLILVGDCNQIPPIGSGFPYKDFIEKYKQHTVFLKTNHRVDANSLQIIHLSQCILNKTPRMINAAREFSRHEPVVFLQRQKDFLTQIKNLLDKFGTTYRHHQEEDIQMITHLNDTRQSINDMYLSTYHRGDSELFVNLKVMILENKKQEQDFDKFIFSDDVCNGDIDYIESIQDILYRKTTDEERKAYQNTPPFIQEKVINVQNTNSIKPPGYRRVIALKNLKRKIDLDYVGKKNIIPAYCITGDKSQGEEFKRVILVFDKNKSSRISLNLAPSLLYTMATRAKQQIIVIADFYPRSTFGELEHVIMAHKEQNRNHELFKFLPSIT